MRKVITKTCALIMTVSIAAPKEASAIKEIIDGKLKWTKADKIGKKYYYAPWSKVKKVTLR